MNPVVAMALVAAGGSLGAAARFLIERGFARRWPTAFPVGILVANVAGSFALGVLLAAADGALLVFAGVGFCGALTTYSTFAHDTIRLGEGGRVGTATANAVVSVVLALAAVAAGLGLGSALAG